MSKKSNKTSHVLNLITNRTGIAAEDLEQAEVPQPEPQEPDKPAAPAAPLPLNLAQTVSEKVEQTVNSKIEEQVNREIERQIEKKVEQEIEQKISAKIADTVSEQIKANLEKIEVQEEKVRAKAADEKDKEFARRRAAMQAIFPNIEHISTIQETPKEEKPAQSVEIESLPKVKTFAPESFEVEEDGLVENAFEEFVPVQAIEAEVDDAPASVKQVETPPVAMPEVANVPETVTAPVPQTAQEDPAAPQKPVNPMEGLVLVNILEEVIKLTAPPVMQDLAMCCCERCLNDVAAITLNALPSKYVVTQRGALFAKISSYGIQYKTDLISSITKACMQVKAAPSHK